MKKIYFMLIFLFTAVTTFSGEIMDKAKQLCQQFILVDTHVDLPLRLNHEWEDISQRTAEGNIDYVRAVEGGLNAPFMSIYVPPRLQGIPEAKEFADRLIKVVERMETEYPDKFKIARSVNDVLSNFDKGIISLPMGMENGAPVVDFELLNYYYEKGIRYITLAHGKWNHICDSSYDEDHHWRGLSPFGKELIKEMNKIGIMVDVSHITDEAFYQVLEISDAPVIASHSSCRYFTPGFERNMSDEMIVKLAEKGGVIQINFGSDFLDQDYKDRKEEIKNKVNGFIEEHHLDKEDPQVKEFEKNYSETHPVGFSNVKKVADHIDHVVKLAGINSVGLGSDFDGVGDTLPDGLKDASMYPNLIAELLQRGYSDEDIQKICSGNLLRVWKQVEDYATKN